ncbi:hypothetical protein E2C01_069839 [Portunus trituberculatus]|uniref:Uncharacterized protein n=1 Tax=Portunus trituberculatus TaxID=210409 RepID=A0A5B7HR48_PORTR|nr:hypothetical protein [Portunus trituberculatus]
MNPYSAPFPCTSRHHHHYQRAPPVLGNSLSPRQHQHQRRLHRLAQLHVGTLHHSVHRSHSSSTSPHRSTSLSLLLRTKLKPPRLLIRNTPESLSTPRTIPSRPSPHHDHEAPFNWSSRHGATFQGTREAHRAVLMLQIDGEASRCVLTHPQHIAHSLR